MQSIQFQVQGSAPAPYEVTFTLDGPELTARCTCPAGFNGTSCKHREAILGGDAKGIVSPNSAQAALIPSWLQGTRIEGSMAELAAAEAALDIAKKRVTASRKALGAAMGGGRRKA